MSKNLSKHGLIFFASVALIGVTVAAASVAGGKGLLGASGLLGGNTSDYTVTLDDSNAYVNNESMPKHVTTSSGSWEIYFNYTNASALSGGHVTLADGGTLVNTRLIKSIDYLKFHFDGNLQFRTSYDGNTWSEYAQAKDNEIYNLPSNPYFVELQANGGSVSLYSAIYQYTCVDNPAAEGYEHQEDDIITWEKVKTVSDFAVGDEVILTAGDSSIAYAMSTTQNYNNRNGVLGEKNGDLFVPTDDTAIFEVESGTTSGSFALNNINGDSTGYIYAAGSTDSTVTNQNYLKTQSTKDDFASFSISISSGVATIESLGGSTSRYMRYNPNTGTNSDGIPRFSFYRSGSSITTEITIYKKVTTPGESYYTYDTPNDIVGFSAIDNNASSYDTNSIYSEDKGLVVKAIYQNGTQTALAASDYTYKVSTDSAGLNVIDHTKAFGTVGIYFVTVSYKDFIPSVLQLNVGVPDPVLTGITVDSDTLTFNTAQKLGDYTNGITVNLTYDQPNANVDNVPYSQFSSYNLSLSLISPSSVAYDISTAFGTSGNWVIKVTSNSDSTVFGQLGITVEAIPVQSISLDESSVTIEQGDTLQLLATVLPDNATNKNIEWSVQNDDPKDCVTVNANGLVTGSAIGTATVVATAQDGSTKFGSCDVTVIAKTQPIDEGTFTYVEHANLQVGSYVVIASSATSGSAYAIGEQRTSNRLAVSTTITSNQTIERTSSSTFYAFRVEEGTISGTVSFYDTVNEGYLYASSSSSNELKVESTKSANSSFALGGSTSINASGSNSRNSMRFNESASTKLFSCYASNNTTMGGVYFFAKAGQTIYPTGVEISGDSTVGVNATTQLTATVTPTNATDKTVSWSSSNDDIATVSSSGLVTGVALGGPVTITASVAGENGTISDTHEISVVTIPVSSVTLDKNNLSIKVGGSDTLSASVLPADATNKEVTWSIVEENPCISVSNGTVTGDSEGTATVKVTSNADNTKYDTCLVTVTAASAGEETTTYMFNSKSWGATPANWSSGKDGNQYDSSKGGIQVTTGASGANGTSPISFESVQSVTVNYCTNASNGEGSITVSVGNTEIATQSVTKTGGATGRDMVFESDGSLSGKINISVECTTNSIYIISCSITTGTPEPIDPTGVYVSNMDITPGSKKTPTPEYTPSNANQNLGITWSKVSGSTNLSIDASTGEVDATNAVAGDSAIFKAALNQVAGDKSCNFTVTVTETVLPKWTIMVYMCGSDLESGGQTTASKASGYASSDIDEMLKASGQTEDTNIIIETGGAKCWSSKYNFGYSISKDKLQRHHISNKTLNLDSTLDTYTSMGQKSTFQSFIEWGLTEYPAEKTGVILWNHGGAMEGCCYDEKSSSDSISNSEVKSALSSAFSNTGRTQKLEWIGYDCCLMSVQDIAEFNSNYFNYMVASEESEAGSGWDYDTWLPKVFNNSATTTILKSIVDSFVAETQSIYWYDQSLSYYSLANMAAYKTAFENFAAAAQSVFNSYGKANLKSFMKGVKSFGNSLTTTEEYQADSDYYDQYGYTWDADFGYYGDWENGIERFGSFDVMDFMTKLKENSTFKNALGSYISAIETAFANLNVYIQTSGSVAAGSNGLAFIYSYDSYTDYYYKQSETNFSNWFELNTDLGA
ncbi:MAG: Ig-like domain-containing protein [Bacilli bacterium]|nr:Ig-like domain-containing protein [Bacilli bacterium]